MKRNSEDISTIFKEIYPNLCRFLESIVGRGSSGYQAQDIAQESFLRLYQADFGQVSTEGIRFWLFRVARNLALNEVNKSKTRTRLWSRAIEFFSPSESNPEDLLVKSEKQRIVQELLNHLSEHQRSALLLREQEEMSYREIALILSVSESKVKIDIFRARQRLRALWFEREDK